jgi:hypothetical protein
MTVEGAAGIGAGVQASPIALTGWALSSAITACRAAQSAYHAPGRQDHREQASALYARCKPTCWADPAEITITLGSHATSVDTAPDLRQVCP